ncbi:nucleoside deaminase [Jannaschia rubra]|uniref:Guanine deaminase n=1 Tax=Jannaschia rubra TaxID=282197 RepID=A0A0M6XSE5_9RHOB|nr:nucleoside deaminase [Jannaschia rubra]CTQ33527.1 Guanine deaminase [Jannaschia rubra]SFG03241.1 tRNA(Arg) A34 adenosine deaminase TadA [Jannaschia rubra]
MTDDRTHMDEAIAIALRNIDEGGRPFGAVLTRDGKVVARAANTIHLDHDPTAHAELMALRAAGRELGTPRLDGCTVYASGQPCPMCMAAMRLAGISRVVYAYSNADGEPYGLSSAEAAEDLSAPFGAQDWARIERMTPDTASDDNPYSRWAAHHRM